MAKEEKGYWFSTENGTHIHAEEGESKEQAMGKKFANFGKKKEKVEEISNGQGKIRQKHDKDMLNDILYEGIRNNKNDNEIINDLRDSTDLFDDYTDEELKNTINFLREDNANNYKDSPYGSKSEDYESILEKEKVRQDDPDHTAEDLERIAKKYNVDKDELTKKWEEENVKYVDDNPLKVESRSTINENQSNDPLKLANKMEKDYTYSDYDKNVKVKTSILDKFSEYGGFEDDNKQLNINEFITENKLSDEDVKQLSDYLTEYNNHEEAKMLNDAYKTYYKDRGGLSTRSSNLINDRLKAENSEKWDLDKIKEYETTKDQRNKKAIFKDFNARGIDIGELNKYKENPNYYKGSVSRELFDKYFNQD